MKKVHFLLSVLAVVLAAGSAFSTVESRRATVWYQSESPGANCSTQFSGEVCAEGSGAQCQIDMPLGTPDVYISKRVNGGSCQEVKRIAL